MTSVEPRPTANVRIFSYRAQEWVKAEIVADLSAADLAAIEEAWRPLREAARSRRAAGQTGLPESIDWDWKRKPEWEAPDAVITFGLRVGEEYQGLLMLQTRPGRSRQVGAADKACLYIEWIETAPWNVKAYAEDDLRYGLVGKQLLRCAVAGSLERGCAGRLALHSLPSAVGFYLRNGFSVIGFDEDAGYDYLELPEGNAARMFEGTYAATES